MKAHIPEALVAAAAQAVVLLDADAIPGGLQRAADEYGSILAERHPDLPRATVDYNSLCFQEAVALRAKAILQHVGATAEGRA